MIAEPIKNGQKTIALLHIPAISLTPENSSRAEIISRITGDIEDDKDIGYAGFLDKGKLIGYLEKSIFDANKATGPLAHIDIDAKKVLDSVQGSILRCTDQLPTDPIQIFVFPTWSGFVAKKMDGTTGYTPWQGSMLLFLDPHVPVWEEALARTVAHEYNHSVFLARHKGETLLELMIMEGLAEHFREQVVGGARAPWTTALGLKQSKTALTKMQTDGILSSEDSKIKHEVLFGSESYALWTGYSLGYHIVSAFLTKRPGLKWPEIMKIKPQDIFEEANFSE